MSDAMDTLEAIVALEGEVSRLRSVNAALVEALEKAEVLYQKGLLNSSVDEIDGVRNARRDALKLAKETKP